MGEHKKMSMEMGTCRNENRSNNNMYSVLVSEKRTPAAAMKKATEALVGVVVTVGTRPDHNNSNGNVNKHNQ